MRVFYSPYAFWLWTHKEREKDEELFFEKFLKEGDVVVDCGAHLGTLTITASKIVSDKGHVYAYEAHPRTFSFLKRNIYDNGCKNVTALHVAVTDTSQSVRFSDYYVNDMNSVEKNGPLEVTGNTLASLLYDVEKVDLLKLDIEGSELQALKGAGGVLKRTKAVYFESAARSFVRFGYTLDDILQFLKENGFTCYLVSNGKITDELQLGHVTKMRYENILALQK
jgi:FkbM family methyltransferase